MKLHQLPQILAVGAATPTSCFKRHFQFFHYFRQRCLQITQERFAQLGTAAPELEAQSLNQKIVHKMIQAQQASDCGAAEEGILSRCEIQRVQKALIALDEAEKRAAIESHSKAL